MEKNIVRLAYNCKFSAGVRLYNPNLSDQENLLLYGRKSNPHGYGDEFHLTINLKGSVDPVTGMVISFEKLTSIIEETILKKVHERFLNKDCEEFQNITPSLENMAIVFWGWLSEKLNNKLLESISLRSSYGITVTYSGEIFGGDDVFDFVI